MDDELSLPAEYAARRRDHIHRDSSPALRSFRRRPTGSRPNTKQEGKQLQGTLKGVDDTLDVTLAGKENRMAAQLKQVSDRHDVALIKIDVPGQLTKVELFDNYDTLKKGENVTIMGYPAASPACIRRHLVEGCSSIKITQLKIIPGPDGYDDEYRQHHSRQ